MSICKYCEKQIYPATTKKNPFKKKKFCNTSCSFKYYNNERTRIANKNNARNCLICQKKYIYKNGANGILGGDKYCSMECGRFASKKYFFNEHFFDKIDSEYKAYWLGFCLADAYNSMDELIIELAKKDKKHLLKFNKNINGNLKIYKKIRKNNYESVLLRIGSRKLCGAIAKLGCIPKKSLVVRFPLNVNPKYYRHIIRGIFDGDGCISKNWSIFSASTKFLKEIKNILSKNNINVLYSSNKNQINLYKKNEIDKIYKYLYSKSNIYLDRKKDKFNRK